jgi:hypothetical protein
MKYVCKDSECGKQFQTLAKIVMYDYTGNLEKEFVHPTDHLMISQTEYYCCPHCGSQDFDEAPAEPVKQEEICNVYIYELTTGAQTELDKLLASGYKVVNRYSKQYHLEKPKQTEIKQ